MLFHRHILTGSQYCCKQNLIPVKYVSFIFVYANLEFMLLNMIVVAVFSLMKWIAFTLTWPLFINFVTFESVWFIVKEAI